MAVFFIFIGTSWSCHSEQEIEPADALFELMKPDDTGIDFINEVNGTDEFNVFTYRNFFNGGGVAIGDVNNDGLSDIYLTSNQHSNKLFLNRGNWKFEDVTDKAGVAGTRTWSTGVTMADVNGDSWLDIYVCNSGDVRGGHRENELFINQQNGTFKEMAASFGLQDAEGLSTHAAFFDYDGDGDLDCYVLNNSYRPIESFGYDRNLRHIRDPKGGDKLFRNDQGHFKDVSESAGIYGSEIGFGLGVTIGDVNGDKWPDIYISNDFFERDYLYINLRNGRFLEILDTAMGHISLSSMGADMADINNDARPDIFSTDMLPEGDYRLKTTTKFDDYDVFNAKLKNDFHHQYTRNALQLNNGDGTFSEIACYAGVYATDWSWGALIFDMDNDGWKDLFVSNGIQKDLTDQDFLDFFSSAEMQQKIRNGEAPNNKYLLDKMASNAIPNYAFINQRNLRFINKSAELGLGRPSFSNGAAYGDLDNDGDLDLVVNNENMPAFLYRNRSREKTGGHYVQIKLKGVGANRFAVGSEVHVYAGEDHQMQQLYPSRGFESSSDYTLHFGLGKIYRVDSIVVIWPDRKMSRYRDLRVDSSYEIDPINANEFFLPHPEIKPIFQAHPERIPVGAMHSENVYTDFDLEKLMPQLVSLEGPKMAKGDLNGDGLEDVVIGAAKGNALKILIQTSGGSFKLSGIPDAEITQSIYEDAGICLSDIDKDGDLDLIVASGGNERNEDPTLAPFAARLYINTGRGQFVRSMRGLPLVTNNSSCALATDIDRDGDVDILIGGRTVTGSFGVTPKSYLFLNDGRGQFTDVSETMAPDWQRAGMVTDAVMADVNGDSIQELCVVGQFMPVTMFAWKQNRLTKIYEIPHSTGWWNCIEAADLDGDMRMDLIGGNLGENSKLTASVKYPLELYVSDFDNNSQYECILTYYKSDSISYPQPLRGEMVGQMPSLKKKFLYYKDYAGKGIQEVFSESQLNKATRLVAETMQSTIFYSRGDLQFESSPLPVRAQLSPIYVILVTDLNTDGRPDLFLGGNFSGVKPEIGGYDANYGVGFLQNANRDTFTYLPPAQSGLMIRGEARDGLLLKAGKRESLLISINNEMPQYFLRSDK